MLAACPAIGTLGFGCIVGKDRGVITLMAGMTATALATLIVTGTTIVGWKLVGPLVELTLG